MSVVTLSQLFPESLPPLRAPSVVPGQEVEAPGGQGQSLHHYTRGLGISGLISIVHWVGGWGVAAIAAAPPPASSSGRYDMMIDADDNDELMSI